MAFPIKLEQNNFILPEFSRSCSVNELNSFRNTEFYNKYFPYKHNLNQKFDLHNSLDEYYYYLQYITKKKEVLSNLEYSFSIPEINGSRKMGITSYDVSIEQVRNSYYFILLNAKMENAYYQGNKELYMIYNREDFINRKNKIENRLSEICLERNLSLDIIKLLYTLVGNRKNLIDGIYEEIEISRKNHDFNLLLGCKNFKVIKDVIIDNPFLLNQLLCYVNGQKECIEYDFKQKLLRK